MNRVEVTGRLTRDPELRFVGQKDFPIASLNLAVDDADGRWNSETKKSEISSGFYRVEVPGEYGRNVANSMNKGDLIYVLGSLQQFRTQPKDGGESKSHTQVRATIVTALTGEAVVGQAHNGDIQPPTDPSWDDEPF